MTGTDRLRTLAGEWNALGLGGALGDVARQIERERACDVDTIENVRLIVGGVIDGMERHVSGVEGAEDSPVARWARELRRALKSDASDSADAQSPSWHDPADAADVTSEAAKVTRDPAEDVSMSAYDLLPEDEREAIAWVRDHGGIGGIERTIASLNDHVYRRQRQIDESHAALRRRNERIAELERERDELRRQRFEAVSAQLASDAALYDLRREVRNQCQAFGVDVSECDTASDMLHDMNEALSFRLMPEGMEWPRFEDGELVRIGGEAVLFDSPQKIKFIQFFDTGVFLQNDDIDQHFSYGERVNRPAPKALDADGAEIRVGDDLYGCESGRGPFEVVEVIEGSAEVKLKSYLDGSEFTTCAETFTHRAPTLAADGKPLRKGETVYHIADGRACVVREVREGGAVVEPVDGRPCGRCRADYLTHERPDRWERLEEDAKMEPGEYCVTYGLCAAYMGREAEEYAKAKDLVRRAKAFAERDA